MYWQLVFPHHPERSPLTREIEWDNTHGGGMLEGEREMAAPSEWVTNT
jgi:hypothetical protein